VQGVGFRPFICRLAAIHGLYGEVENRTNGVTVRVQGDIKAIDRFSNDILEKAPPASNIKSIEVIPRSIETSGKFVIADSKSVDGQITEISPDIAVCPDCLADMSSDPQRIDYPLINCTNCGPRFTITESLPYDRPNTTMKHFTMCVKCASEYHDILNRRFHAQPTACNLCGPEYSYRDPAGSISGTVNILLKISSDLEEGKSVAVKGVGGYFLMCDALNNQAVSLLRERKQRDSKPFAVMFRDISTVKRFCYLDNTSEKELSSWRRPVVILREKKKLASAVNSGLNTIGAMLPCMPFHYLLFRYLKTPAVVLTSGNLSEEPIIIDDDEASTRLMPVSGAIAGYNRIIYNRADDSVIRIINNKPSLIRRSRGYAPRPVDLIFPVDGILALGPEQKNTFCLGKNNQAIVSQHIGDLKNAATYDFFREAIERFSMLFRFRPLYLACDMHPDYFSTMYASELAAKLNINAEKVQHHHAHIVSCMAEHGIDEKVIGICMDGTGYGTDGNIWGGEFFVADASGFERITHFGYVPVPGGDKASNEPWRMAYAYLLKYFGEDFEFDSIPSLRSVDKTKKDLVRQMIVKQINSPLSSSAGRLFDSVSAILGLCPNASFDSEAPMRLESAIHSETDLYYPFEHDSTIGFAATFRGILDDLPRLETSMISVKFHNTIAEIIFQVSREIRENLSLKKVILSGGVFQNKYLLEKSTSKLKADGFMVYSNHLVPSNDGGISLGQLVVTSKKLGLCV
jgi:hydrogenase maturation protein HypF